MATKENRQLTAGEREALGIRLLQRRLALRWSQRELGRRTGIRHVRISKLEHGRVTPTVPELLLLSRALGLGLDELVLGMPAAAAPESTPPTQEEAPLPLARLEELGSPEEWAVLGKLLRALVAGLTIRKGEP
jgi:HTH-type transcriptional regulator / antitoxin HipB